MHYALNPSEHLVDYIPLAQSLKINLISIIIGDKFCFMIFNISYLHTSTSG